jgi:glyoxylase I family protein
MFNRVHHIAIICSDYAKSKHFYVEILGLKIVREVYREERRSFKLDLQVGKQYQLELFSFTNPPARPTSPEACGLRHIALEVGDVQDAARRLRELGIEVEPIRVDEFTAKSSPFFAILMICPSRSTSGRTSLASIDAFVPLPSSASSH